MANEAMRALIARQTAQLGADFLKLPDGIVRAPWFDEEPARDSFWTHPGHHPASGVILGSAGGCRWIAVQMAFNWRLIGVPVEYEESYAEYGWCFGSPKALMLAANAWDPETENEPLGWHKRAGSARRAPFCDRLPEYNRLRCVHGSYIEERTCTVDPFCQEMR